MRAGLLRETVTFKEPRRVTTDTGGVDTRWVEVLTCRAWKRKFSNVTDKDKVEAHKQFYGHFGVFQVRARREIHEDMILVWRGVEYKIILIDPQADGTLLINVNKESK